MRGSFFNGRFKRNIVIGVILVTVGLWVTGSLHGIKAAAVCAVPLVVLTLTGILNGKDIQTLGWDTLLLVPICLAVLPSLKMEVALIIALSSSSALLLLASSPSNAIVFNTGYLEQKDFRLTGIIFGLLGPLLAIVWVLLIS